MPLIYIVEDDANIREIEQFSLESAGYSTRAFTCAKDFYAALLEKAPSLCLLDVMLPDEDGLSIVKAARGRSHKAPARADGDGQNGRAGQGERP